MPRRDAGRALAQRVRIVLAWAEPGPNGGGAPARPLSDTWGARHDGPASEPCASMAPLICPAPVAHAKSRIPRSSG